MFISASKKLPKHYLEITPTHQIAVDELFFSPVYFNCIKRKILKGHFSY